MNRKPVIFRPHDWIDLKTSKPVFGMQARQIGRAGWMHVYDGRKPLFFTQRRDRDREIKRLKRQEAERRRAAGAHAAGIKGE